MLDDKWKERIRRAARPVLYVIVALYLAALYGTITHIESAVSSMKSNIDSLQSDVSSMQDDVSSIQDDVSSIRDDLDSIESTPSLFTPRPVTARKAKWVEGRKPYVMANGLRPPQMAYKRTHNRPPLLATRSRSKEIRLE